MMARRAGWAAAVAVTALVAAGCGGHAGKHVSEKALTGMMRGTYSETDGSGGSAGSSAGGSAGGSADSSGDIAAAPSAAAVAPAGSAAAPAGSPAAGMADSDGAPAVAPTPSNQLGLRAGSVDDNARFTEYASYRQQYLQLGLPAHSFDITARHIFTVTNDSGDPILGADVAISDLQGNAVAQLQTYSDGRALWFPQQQDDVNTPLEATITRGKAMAEVRVNPGVRDYDITLNASGAKASVPLDIEFVVDATGSMGDEIAQLKASLSDIAARIDALPAQPDVHFALTIYRDRSDAYVTRTWNFSSDLGGFEQEISGVAAFGGGDYPEDVQQGLYDALHKPAWRGPGAVKLMFLLGDAPPHLDYPDDPDYIATAVDAAKLGIKIETLAASGLDDEGEFIWRQLAEITSGQFMFLTYGPNGGPGNDTTHHVSGYAPMNLDDLVVNLVSQELSPVDTYQQ